MMSHINFQLKYSNIISPKIGEENMLVLPNVSVPNTDIWCNLTTAFMCLFCIGQPPFLALYNGLTLVVEANEQRLCLLEDGKNVS